MLEELTEAATGALRALLGEGEVTIFNIGPDKYAERVVADAIDAADWKCLEGDAGCGHARSYNGGHRAGWCANAGQSS